MKRKSLLVSLIICLLLSSLALTGCTEETTPTPASSTPTTETSTPGATVNWWDDLGEPQYGGTINLYVNNTSDLGFDTYDRPWKEGYGLFYFECLFSQDWTLDRDTWAFNTDYTPEEYFTGYLVESWENPDGQNIIIHLKQGIHFQNKEPVNGRELVATDVEYHYDRICGIGSGFTEACPFHANLATVLEDVNAIDDYTVEFKFYSPSAVNIAYIMGWGKTNYIEAPEVSQMYGDLSDWHNAVGTGPWILADFVDGSAVKYEKNPDYWGYDERYPENQLPYADELNIICIPDASTALASLRTGKVDVLYGVDWKRAQSAAKSNPELLQSEIPTSGISVLLNTTLEPMTELNVRKAMQMSINRPLIAEALYGNLVEGLPCGEINPALEGYAYPYEEWPQELKDEYTYNPDGAKALLAAAGYPDGFDVEFLTSSTSDLQMLETIKAQFADIGVNAEINTMDITVMTSTILAKNYEIAYTAQECGTTSYPWTALMQKTPFHMNPNTVDDPTYNAICEEIMATVDQNTIKELCQEADAYMLSQHWQVALFPIVTYNMWQPSLKGYSGEVLGDKSYYSRLWKVE